jgi:hypothetical protein
VELTCGLGGISSGSSDAFYAYTFSLAQITGYASYAATFDSWRISAVNVQFVQADRAITSSPVFTVIDYDDVTTLAIADMYQYDTLKLAGGDSPYFERTLAPKLSMAAYGGSTFNSSVQGRGWVQTAEPATPWYGLKVILAASTVGVPDQYFLYARIVFQFKNTR